MSGAHALGVATIDHHSPQGRLLRFSGMPFTVSHAAAVLPLHRLSKGRLPLAAMMIGSMSPDFAYFLPMGLGRGSTHDLEGLFLFCWPVGLAVWLLYVRLLERATIELLPLAWRERVSRSDSELSIRSLALVSLGVILGAITHIAWDSFTHANTIMTDTFPALSAELFTFPRPLDSRIPGSAVPEFDSRTRRPGNLGLRLAPCISRCSSGAHCNKLSPGSPALRRRPDGDRGLGRSRLVRLRRQRGTLRGAGLSHAHWRNDGLVRGLVCGRALDQSPAFRPLTTPLTSPGR